MKQVGDTGEYIYDLPAYCVMKLEPEVASVMLKVYVPEGKLNGKILASYDPSQLINGFLNKGYIVIQETNHGFVAIYNHDGQLYLHTVKESK